ncbi:MAG: putative type nitrate/sulfonate/bicarbonate transport system, periplasmic component [Ramlibacter sp.]|nr:putative type nitrate/sulfonate/bicarbonate transport system, periplasmic component [Ramlibacter sp.]
MNQRIARRALLASLAAAPLAAWTQAPQRLDKIVVAGWSKPITEVTPLLVEQDKGFYRAHGIALEYVPGAGSADAIRNILGGQADVAFTDPGTFFAALDKGEMDATAATDTGLLIGRRRGLPEVNVIQVGKYLPVSSDLFVVREETYHGKRAALRRFLRGYGDAAAWMMAKPEEAAQLAVKRAIDGTDPALNLEIIRLRNAASVSDLTRRSGLGAMDVASLQQAADTYRRLGLITKPLDVSKWVSQDLLPGRRGEPG